MTLNNFIRAIASQLTALWPDRKVYVDRIPQNADGNFFVRPIESEQEQHLDRRRKRLIQFEVLYFLRSDENMAFYDWAEAMFDNFEKLTVKEGENAFRGIWLSGQSARKNEEMRAYQFTFDADFYYLLAVEEGVNMENLSQKEELKQ